MTGLHPRLTREAIDPATTGPRLATLAARKDAPEVARLAKRHPNLPSDQHRALLVAGDPDAWASPQTHLTLVMEPMATDLHEGALVCAQYRLQAEPRPDLHDLRAVLSPAIQAWWDGCNASSLARFLGEVAAHDGPGSAAHRSCIHVLVLCCRMAMPLARETVRSAFEEILCDMDEWAMGRTFQIQSHALRGRIYPFKKAAIAHNDMAHALYHVASATDSKCAPIESHNAMLAILVAAGVAASKRAAIESAVTTLVRATIPVCPLIERLP